MNDYYANSDVRARMCEFLGGASVGKASCVYLTAGDTRQSRHREPIALGRLAELWDAQLDISRSLWDHESLIFHLDVEYVNFDAPGEVFLRPERAYELQRPVELAIEAVLLDYGIRALHLLSGRGHHFVWRVRQDSEAFRELAGLGRVPTSLRKFNRRPHPPGGESVSAQLGRAYSGLGMVMEYLAHRIKDAAAEQAQIPVEFTAVEAGPGGHGREVISIDISEYGDPLSSRVIRVPFSFYLKPEQQSYLFGGAPPQTLLPVFLIPLQGVDTAQGLHVMRDMGRVMDLAKKADARIPDESGPVRQLLAAYRDSALRTFHDWYYSRTARPAHGADEAGGELPRGELPLCVRQDLERPNDLLLRPGHIQRYVRVLLSLGWHPRRVAGLLESIFEADHGWGDQWTGYNPGLRADFYTRLFAGEFISGHDDLVDFNCQSAKEEKLCAIANCPFNLADYRDSLLNRRKYERLARRPFNRLFLPQKHL